MATLSDSPSRHLLLTGLVVVLLLGLPLAVWLDLRNISDTSLRRQAADIDSLLTSIRSYYANNVVSRVMANPGDTRVVHNYHDTPSGIPIPATLSIELARTVSERQFNIAYRFISDHTFANRSPHILDAFEKRALTELRAKPDAVVTESSWTALTDRVRLISPIRMDAACVSCHNSHPQSMKTDWRLGDVRGIQEVSISQPIATNIWSFKYVLDVVGHGPAAAMLAFAVTRVLTPGPHSFLIRADGDGGQRVLEPSEVARQLGQRFPFETGTEQFFTLLYGVLDLRTNEFRFVSAGHPWPIRLSRAGEAPRVLAGEGGLPIGIADERYEEQVATLQPGDRVYLYSDGIPEAMNTKGELFGMDRLLESLAASRAVTLADSVSALWAAIEAWSGGAALVDDATLVVVQIE